MLIHLCISLLLYLIIFLLLLLLLWISLVDVYLADFSEEFSQRLLRLEIIVYCELEVGIEEQVIVSVIVKDFEVVYEIWIPTAHMITSFHEETLSWDR